MKREMTSFSASTRLALLLVTHQRRTALAFWNAELGLVQSEKSGQMFKLLGSKDTAEELSDLYSSGLLSLGEFSDRHVSEVYFCEGPGSFTGLRIGCAFLNGLLLGRARKAFAVREMLSEKDLDSKCALPFTLDDLDRNLEYIRLGNHRQVQSFEPHYGREPGPVLLLRQTLEGV